MVEDLGWRTLYTMPSLPCPSIPTLFKSESCTLCMRGKGSVRGFGRGNLWFCKGIKSFNLNRFLDPISYHFAVREVLAITAWVKEFGL
ncbi:hypothetical protein SUGI_1491880 [Cryptomeria japonica]|uniref:Uncharacterized protein n=1 Tax=Cryptomeria japonica TaxID=3369 RepID=A0AAD3RRL8_CRYJA|nr:hypothetical protein SUGI_1491880 [Cryptomeria japonica]